jgi:hypothetical protein
MVDNAAGVGGTPLPFCGASGEDYEKSLSETAVYQSEAVQGRTSPIRRGNPDHFGEWDIHLTQVARWPPQQVEKNAVCGHKILWQPA